jgi:[protein-PII] uridylyltransferase
VRAARVTTIGDLAVEEFDVDPSTGGWPDIDRTHARLEAAVTGTLPLEGLLADRQRSYRSGGPRPDIAPEVLFEAASDTTVIEVRAADSVGLLYRVAAALSDLGLDVVQVHAATIGHEAVDAFYVRGLDPVRQREVTEAVVAAVAAP